MIEHDIHVRRALKGRGSPKQHNWLIIDDRWAARRVYVYEFFERAVREACRLARSKTINPAGLVGCQVSKPSTPRYSIICNGRAYTPAEFLEQLDEGKP